MTLYVGDVPPVAAPNTLWHLLRTKIETTPPHYLFLPSAWADEVSLILKDPALEKRLVAACQTEESHQEFYGWVASCLLRDRRIAECDVATRASLLIVELGGLRDIVNGLDVRERNSIRHRISMGGARDVRELIASIG